MSSKKKSNIVQELLQKTGLKNLNPKVLKLVCVLVAVVVVIAIARLVLGGESTSLSFGTQSAEDSQLDGEDDFALPVEEASYIFVYVCGAVVNPGVYHLAADGRVIDALEMAGGWAEGASTTAVNLARSVSDGEQIYFPTSAEVQQGWSEASGSGGQGSQGSSSGLVNINTADASELDTLPGIGPSTAEKIIAYRKANGSFSSIEDIKNVSGIGDAKFEEIRNLIEV